MVVGDLEIRLRADIARLQADMAQARRTVTETQDKINAAANAMKTALAGIGIGAGLAEIIKMADEYAKFTISPTSFLWKYACAPPANLASFPDTQNSKVVADDLASMYAASCWSIDVLNYAKIPIDHFIWRAVCTS